MTQDVRIDPAVVESTARSDASRSRLAALVASTGSGCVHRGMEERKPLLCRHALASSPSASPPSAAMRDLMRRRPTSSPVRLGRVARPSSSPATSSSCRVVKWRGCVLRGARSRTAWRLRRLPSGLGLHIGVSRRALGPQGSHGRSAGALWSPSKDATFNRPPRLTQQDVDRVACPRDGEGGGAVVHMEGVDGGDLLARQRECGGCLERHRLQREPRVPPREKLFEVDRAVSCWSKVGKSLP